DTPRTGWDRCGRRYPSTRGRSPRLRRPRRDCRAPRAAAASCRRSESSRSRPPRRSAPAFRIAARAWLPCLKVLCRESKAGTMPRRKRQRRGLLREGRAFRMSSPGDNERLRSAVCPLVVIELDVRLVEEGDVEAEREVAVGALHEREAGVPAVQVALEAHVMLGELLGDEIVARSPRQRPVRGRAERQREPHLLRGRTAFGRAGKSSASTPAG